MQILPVYLYPNNLDVILDVDPTVQGVNQVMYQRDLKIQKGIKNNVRIQFKNSDQKRIPIDSTGTFVFSMFDTISQRLVIEKELSVLDVGTTATRGIALLSLTESDTLDLDKSSYQYSIKMLDTDGTYLPTYSNTYYGIPGTLHILDDINPVLQPSTKVEDFQISFNAATNFYEYKSRALYANPEFNSNTALHTVAVYMTNYSGTVSVQATLNNNPIDQSFYATIETRTYSNFTGVDYINFNGIFSYVNILHVPAQGPTDLDNLHNISYRGTLDKILFRS